MPGKPKNLPLPCPICDSPHGTIQLAFSKDEIIVRIGHYNSKGYKEAKKEYEDSLKTTDENIDLQQKSGKLEGLKKKIRTEQRKWCSFRSNNGYIRSLEDEITEDILSSPLTPIPGKRDIPPRIINLSEDGKLDLRHYIQRFGWKPMTN